MVVVAYTHAAYPLRTLCGVPYSILSIESRASRPVDGGYLDQPIITLTLAEQHGRHCPFSSCRSLPCISQLGNTLEQHGRHRPFSFCLSSWLDYDDKAVDKEVR
jgi:hypothetical protein